MLNAATSPLEEMLALWCSITGVNPKGGATTSMAAYDDRSAYKELVEAMELDPTDITATLLLSHQLNEYLQKQTVNLAKVLRDPAGLVARMEPIHKLSEYLNDVELLETRDRFIKAVRDALVQYGVSERQDVEKLLSSPDEIALLRRDALRSMKDLRVDQFLDGNAEPAGIRPVYTKVVHQWWNLNSMLTALTSMPAGVSVNMIRSPGGFQSYFAFVIRNGGNLFVLTDVPEFAHPLAAAMSRRPDRALHARASRNWFPYDLLDVGFDEETGRLYMEATRERSIVAYQTAARPLKPISELDPPVVVWLAMMFDLIVERFWKQAYKAPALSYTGEMLEKGSRLITAAHDANLPVPLYTPIGLAPLELADVHSSAVTESEVGRRFDNPNAWLEERFKDSVHSETLNLTGMPEQKLFLEADGTVTGAAGDSESGSGLNIWEREELAKSRTKLNVMNSTTFGSREKMAADRKFIARANYASQISSLAAKEFAERKDEIFSWYLDRVKANKLNLMLWSGNTEIWCGGHPSSPFGGGYDGNFQAARVVQDPAPGAGEKARLTYHQFICRTQIGQTPYGFSAGKLLSEYDRTRGPLCELNATKASYYVTFAPTTATELALLAGCVVQDLPDVLQQWTLQSQYRGNEILDRIDPLVWKAKNPWLRMDFRVSLAFSKRAIDKFSKEPVVPPVTNLYVEKAV